MNERFNEKLNRMLAAVHMEKPDRIPVMASGSAVNAMLTGTKLSDYCADMDVNLETNLKGIQMVGDPDAVQVTIFEPKMLDACWFGHMETPDVELGENDLWQMIEKQNVDEEDYDRIIEEGFGPWYMEFLTQRLHWNPAVAENFAGRMPQAIGAFAEAGFPCFCCNTYWTPIEMFCGGRTLVEFMTTDLMEEPDKVERVFDIVQEFNMNGWRAQLDSMPQKPLAVWVGGWRGTPDMLSPEMFERFSWRYMKEVAEMVIGYGIIPLFHLDSNWTNGVKYFKELPRNSFIMGFDGQTDIFKAKETIGDHACIMGDVPATMLSFGTPKDVDAYCEKLIRELGPTGFILSSGCDAPYNSKRECLEAMYAAPLKHPIS